MHFLLRFNLKALLLVIAFADDIVYLIYMINNNKG